MEAFLFTSFIIISGVGIWFIWFLINDTIKYYQKKKKRRMNNR